VRPNESRCTTLAKVLHNGPVDLLLWSHGVASAKAVCAILGDTGG
jgi:hypothetical protein